MNRTDHPMPEPIRGRIASSRNALVVNLSRFASLSDDEIGLLQALCAKQEQVGAGVNLAVEGNAPRRGFVITHGLACRYRVMPDGRRQILTFLIPGDVSDPYLFLLKAMDHSIITLVPTRLARIERARVFEITEHHPRIVAALWWVTMQEAAMLRERIVMLGRANARARVAYLFCEFLWRYRAIGLSEDHALRLPLTQLDIADALGLTAVHVNRVLQHLRREGLITMAHRRLTVHYPDRLQRLAELGQDYLHLTSMPADVERYLGRMV